MSDLIERMRAKLEHGVAHKRLAVAVDLEDLAALIALGGDGERFRYMFEMGWVSPESIDNDKATRQRELDINSEIWQ